LALKSIADENPPWVRIASSVQAWAENSLEARSALGSGAAGLQAVVTRRKRGAFVGV
jgi:hypothetical protein